MVEMAVSVNPFQDIHVNVTGVQKIKYSLGNMDIVGIVDHMLFCVSHNCRHQLTHHTDTSIGEVELKSCLIIRV
jgi:hypothetical protein